MSKKLKAILSVAVVAVLIVAMSIIFIATSNSVTPNRQKFTWDDFDVALSVEKGEYTLEELKENDNTVKIVLTLTNNTGEELVYLDSKEEVGEVHFSIEDIFGGYLVTHKDGMRYAPASEPLGFTFRTGNANWTYGNWIIMPCVIGVGESFTVEVKFNFSYTYAAKDGEAAHATNDVGVVLPNGTVGSPEQYQFKEISYNNDYALSGDETYKALGTDEYYIYGVKDEVGYVVEGYYSLVFNSVLYANCIKIG